jgi:hypothetical protein
MFNDTQYVSPFESYAGLPIVAKDIEAEAVIDEINNQFDEPVAVIPEKKVKHRLPGIRLLRQLEKERLKEQEKQQEIEEKKEIDMVELPEPVVIIKTIDKMKELRERIKRTLGSN